jgi:hypothetical protein
VVSVDERIGACKEDGRRDEEKDEEVVPWLREILKKKQKS